MLGSYLECLFLGGFPWLLPKSSFYLPGRVCCVGSESVGAQWQCHPQGHPVCPSWPCWSCPSAAPSSSPPAHGGMEGPCQPCCCTVTKPQPKAQLVLSSQTQQAAAFHSCLLRPSGHDLDHADPSYTRGIRFFFQGDVQSVFLQLFFLELVPGNSDSSLGTAMHLPPSSACPDFPSTGLS